MTATAASAGGTSPGRRRDETGAAAPVAAASDSPARASSSETREDAGRDPLWLAPAGPSPCLHQRRRDRRPDPPQFVRRIQRRGWSADWTSTSRLWTREASTAGGVWAAGGRGAERSSRPRRRHAAASGRLRSRGESTRGRRQETRRSNGRTVAEPAPGVRRTHRGTGSGGPRRRRPPRRPGRPHPCAPRRARAQSDATSKSAPA